MQTQQIFLFFIGIVALSGLIAFFVGRGKAQKVRASGAEMYAQPDQYGWFTAISCAGPALLVGLAAVLAIATAGVSIEGAELLAASLVVAGVGMLIGLALVKPDFHARNAIETLIRYVLIGAAMISIVTTFGILASIIFEAIRFFQMESFWTFITGTTWDPGNSFQLAAGR
ncbi:phosphate ABC transporter permease family protein, partial [Cobetia marina]